MSFTIKELKLHDGHMMKATVFGNGSQPMVLLQGLSFEPAWKTAMITEGRFKAYEDRFTFYLIDRKEGFGEHYTIEQMAADTAEGMRLLGIGGAEQNTLPDAALDSPAPIVYGVSQGGMIALSLAMDYPELVGRLIVCVTSASCPDKQVPAANQLAENSSPAEYPEINSKPIFTNWLRLARSGEIYNLALDTIKHVYSQAYVERYDRAIDHLIRTYDKKLCEPFGVLTEACLEFDREKELSKINCPTLVIGATNDKIFGVAPSKIIAEKTGGKLMILEGSHAIYEENPQCQIEIMNFALKGLAQ